MWSHWGTPVLCEAIEVHLCCVRPADWRHKCSTVLRYTCVVLSHWGTPVLCETIKVHLCCVKPLRYTCVVWGQLTDTTSVPLYWGTPVLCGTIKVHLCCVRPADWHHKFSTVPLYWGTLVWSHRGMPVLYEASWLMPQVFHCIEVHLCCVKAADWCHKCSTVLRYTCVVWGQLTDATGVSLYWGTPVLCKGIWLMPQMFHCVKVHLCCVRPAGWCHKSIVLRYTCVKPAVWCHKSVPLHWGTPVLCGASLVSLLRCIWDWSRSVCLSQYTFLMRERLINYSMNEWFSCCFQVGSTWLIIYLSALLHWKMLFLFSYFILMIDGFWTSHATLHEPNITQRQECNV